MRVKGNYETQRWDYHGMKKMEQTESISIYHNHIIIYNHTIGLAQQPFLWMIWSTNHHELAGFHGISWGIPMGWSKQHSTWHHPIVIAIMDCHGRHNTSFKGPQQKGQ